MPRDLIFVEACSRCGRVGRVNQRYQARRKTPLVCVACQEEMKDSARPIERGNLQRRG